MYSCIIHYQVLSMQDEGQMYNIHHFRHYIMKQTSDYIQIEQDGKNANFGYLRKILEHFRSYSTQEER